LHKFANEKAIELIEVEYEGIIENSNSATADIDQWLGVNGVEDAEDWKSGNFVLSDSELGAKHANVKKNAMLERTNAWKNELDVADGVIVESFAGRYVTEKYFSTNKGNIVITSFLARGFIIHIFCIFLRIFEYFKIILNKIMNRISLTRI